jgi:hypothetical protein
MAKIARQWRRVETQPDKVDMGGMHDIALYNVNLFTGTSFQRRAYTSPAQMASRDCFFFLHFCTQTEKNVARTVDDPRARRRRSDTHGAKTTCSSTKNAHIVCANHLPRPGSRQFARPCRSKMRGVSACPLNIFQKGYENLVYIFRTWKKSCTWVHVIVSKRRKVARDGFRESITHGGVKIDNRLELLAKNQIKL